MPGPVHVVHIDIFFTIMVGVHVFIRASGSSDRTGSTWIRILIRYFSFYAGMAAPSRLTLVSAVPGPARSVSLERGRGSGDGVRLICTVPRAVGQSWITLVFGRYRELWFKNTMIPLRTLTAPRLPHDSLTTDIRDLPLEVNSGQAGAH